MYCTSASQNFYHHDTNFHTIIYHVTLGITGQKTNLFNNKNFTIVFDISRHIKKHLIKNEI